MNISIKFLSVRVERRKKHLPSRIPLQAFIYTKNKFSPVPNITILKDLIAIHLLAQTENES
jgi:hypothetical protein